MEHSNISTAILRSLVGFQNINLENNLPSKNYDFKELSKEIKNPNGRIRIESSDALIKSLIAQSNNESLCVFASKSFNIQGNCVLQHLFLSADNLQEALSYLKKYALLLSDDFEITITHTQNQGVCIQLPVFKDYLLSAPRHRTEILISTVISWIQLLCGQQWHPQVISLPFPETRYSDAYRKNWLSKIEFNADKCGITFSQSWMDMDLNNTNPHVKTIILRDVECEFRKLSRSMSLTTSVYSAFINKKIPLNANQHEVAELFNISARTLNRHLQKDCVSLKQLVTQVRIEIAKQILQDEDISIERLSLELGLSGRRTLDRIFMREVGMSPSRYKQNCKHLQRFTEQNHEQHPKTASA